MISPAQTLGILGGGQLGSFFCIAARQLGYRVTVWDPHESAPAGAWANHFIHAPFSDIKARQLFIRSCKAASYEWENVPVSLLESLEKEMLLRPGSRILRLLQNRISEKDFLSRQGFPVTPYRHIKQKEALQAATEALGLPAILKTATAGYDGQGQWRLRSTEDVSQLASELRPRPAGWVLEKVAPFLKELSIVAARDEAGAFVSYPVTENTHEDGILRRSQVPAGIKTSLAKHIAKLAEEVLEALEGTGLFCLEFFLLENDRLMINEIAPRPHNSGHYSLDMTSTSQFEQQVRALCGLPLVRPSLSSPAMMINILGAEIMSLRREKSMKALLEIPELKVYDYGKSSIRPRRKMGHITIGGSGGSGGSPLRADAERVQSILDEVSAKEGTASPAKGESGEAGHCCTGIRG